MRISCDTRWQRKDQPADSRFMGEKFPLDDSAPKHGLWAEKREEQSRTMADMKIKWNI